MINQEPTVYNIPNVYGKEGAGNGVLFYTWFDNVVNNNDVPIIGNEYSIYDENAITSTTNLNSEKFIGYKTFLCVENKNHSNVAINVKTPAININSFFSFNFLFCAAVSANFEPNFIWINFNSFQLVLFLSKDGTDYLDIWVSANQTINVFNGAAFEIEDFGFKQYRILNNAELYKVKRFKAEYHAAQKLVITINDIVYIQIMCDIPEDVSIRIDPRNNGKIYLSDIMVREEP